MTDKGKEYSRKSLITDMNCLTSTAQILKSVSDHLLWVNHVNILKIHYFLPTVNNEQLPILTNMKQTSNYN